MNNLTLTIQALSGLLLVIVILVQTRGQGFARGWGSSASFTRRGLEKVVFKSTFVLAFIFIAVSIVRVAL